MKIGSKKVTIMAIQMAISESREEEEKLKQKFRELGVKAAAVDYGGEFITSVKKIIERTVVAAKREGVIKETHSEEGAIAGATREALSQIMTKAIGLNVGGKIGMARKDDHLTIVVFFGIGLVHLDEISIGIAHRAVS
jgi:hypothetical protein